MGRREDEYGVLFLNVEFKLDAAGDGGGYSELYPCEYSIYKISLVRSLTPSKSLMLMLATSMAISEDHVPWLKARIGSERLPNLE
jgi:hypothetical protein